MSKLNHSFRQRATINFTQVTNNVLQNPNLSFKAKGLYAYIQSYLFIPNFNLTKSFLMNNCIEGDKAFNSAWKELKDSGFLKQYRIPNTEEKGKFLYEYELLLEADTSIPALLNCDKNGNVIIKEPSENNKSDHIYQNDRPYTPKRTICSKDDMLRGGDNNNTIYNNTNLNNINNSSSSEDEEHELKLIMKCCQECSFKLKKDKARLILKSYDYIKIIKAINKITASGATIKNYSGYLLKTLEEMDKIKVININSANKKEIDAKSFNNFEAREYDYDALENKLLGWDK